MKLSNTTLFLILVLVIEVGQAAEFEAAVPRKITPVNEKTLLAYSSSFSRPVIEERCARG